MYASKVEIRNQIFANDAVFIGGVTPTPKIEKAYIYSIARVSKKRLTGGSSLSLRALGKLHYPFYMVQYDTGTILADPLGAFSLKIRSPDVTHIEEMINSLSAGMDNPKGNRFDVERFRDQITLFAASVVQFSSSRESVVSGVLEKREALAVEDYLKSAKNTNGKVDSEVVVLARPYDEIDATKCPEQLDQLKKQFNEDLAKLNDALTILDEATSNSIGVLRDQIVGLEDNSYSFREDRREISLSPDQLRAKKRFEIVQSAARYEEKRELLRATVEEYKALQVKLEDDYNALAFLKESRAKMRSRSAIDPNFLDATMEEIPRRIRDAKQQIEEINDVITNLERERNKELSLIDSSFDALIDRQDRIFESSKAARRIGIMRRKAEIDEIMENATSIHRHLNLLMDQVKSNIQYIEQLANNEEPFGKPGLALVPLYVSMYEGSGTPKFFVIPPCLAKEIESKKNKNRKVFRSGGLADHYYNYTPYSDQFKDMFEAKLSDLINSDLALQGEMNRKLMRCNILADPMHRREIFDSIEQLEILKLVEKDEAVEIKREMSN
jgi:hypothetical protein